MWLGRNAFRTSESAIGVTGAAGAACAVGAGAARRVAAKANGVVRQRNIPSKTRSRGRNVGITEFRRKSAIDDRSGERKLSTKNTAKHLLERRTILKKTPNNSPAKAHQVSLPQKYRGWLSIKRSVAYLSRIIGIPTDGSRNDFLSMPLPRTLAYI